MSNSDRSEFKILISLIEIWSIKSVSEVTNEPSDAVLYITDINNIDIIESYKKLISTAQIKFPRGTVVKKTYTKNSEPSEHSIQISITDTGILKETYVNTEVLGEDSSNMQIKVGDRIRVYLGYTTDPSIAALTKSSEAKNIYNDSESRQTYKNAMKCMFNGYIAQCSVDSPVMIKCENLAYHLKKKSCPDIPEIKDATVNKLLASDGEYKLLEGTGIELYPKTKEIDINIGTIGLNPHMTVADVLLTWSKKKLYTFLIEEGGKIYLAVGRIYSSNINDKDNVVSLLESPEQYEIDFSYHVAQNGLSLMKTDPMFIACEVSYVPEGSNKFARLTIRKDPQKAGEYQILNETKFSKNQVKASLANNK